MNKKFTNAENEWKTTNSKVWGYLLETLKYIKASKTSFVIKLCSIKLETHKLWYFMKAFPIICALHFNNVI